jgi:hypothetical protein
VPVPILTFQLVAEAHFIRRDEAQRRVIDSQISDERWQLQPVRRIVGFVIGSDLLDSHRRRNLIDQKMTRIDDLNAFPGHEPQFAIRGFRDTRAVFAGRTGADPDTIRCIPDRRGKPTLRIGDPGIHFGPRDTHQAAAHVQPERTLFVLDSPIRSVAGQAIPARERLDVAIFDPAQAA